MVSYTDPSSVETQSPGFIDAAETFAESDVTVSHTTTQITAESVEIPDNVVSSTADRPDDTGTQTGVTNGYGIEIEPQSDLLGVDVEISSNTGTPQDVFIADSNENILTEKTAGYVAGDIVRLQTPLTANTKYFVGTYDNGSSFDAGRHGSPSFPYTSTDVNITNGAENCHPDDGFSVFLNSSKAYSFTSVSALEAGTNGTAYVEWPQPNDVYGWDVATFTKTTDGETVDVYLEESTDGGATWTTIVGPIDRGQDIPASPDSEVRYRVELSRANVANNPTLDSIYRRYTV